MDELIITGCAPYDGRYELDLERELTTREWGWIKRLAGYLPAAVTDDTFGDPEFACALAVIALRRQGRIQNPEVPAVYERLADGPFGSSIRFEAAPEVAPSDPPMAGPNLNGNISGVASPANSGTPATPPSPTGTPASDTSVSVPVTSGS